MDQTFIKDPRYVKLEEMRMIVQPGEYGLGTEPGSHPDAPIEELWARLGDRLEELEKVIMESDVTRIRKILQAAGEPDALIAIYMEDLGDAEPCNYAEHTDAEILADAAEYIAYIKRGEAR